MSRHANGAVEVAEVDFQILVDDEAAEIEQIAEKISVMCSQRGWKTSKMGFCLREGTAVTFQTPIVTVPLNEVDDAVKTWAVAQIGDDALCTSIKFDDGIWMEAIPKAAAKEYVSAWKKNSMTLCALTMMPEEISMQIKLVKPIEYADFVAEVIATKKTPNLISDYLTTWNYRKISAAIAAIFLCVLVGIFAKVNYDYHVAAAQVKEIQVILAEREDDLALKKIIDENIFEMKRLNALCAAQFNSVPSFNALVKLGKIADGKTRLTKIKISENVAELEGVADNPDEIRSYVNRLKTNVTPNVKLGNFSSDDGTTTFTIHLTLKD